LLNCLNGTIDLKARKFRPHDANDFITKIANVEYDPTAEVKEFKKFINKVLNNNQSVINYLQRALGYSLTGITNEQAFFILQGPGSNGKTVLLDVIRFILNDYSINSEFRTFIKQTSTTVRNDIARMNGARFVTAVEGDKESYLDEALLKSITGGDPIATRFLYQEYFDYIPTFKIFFATNYLPKISNSGHSIWRRIKIIHFNVVIPPEEQDKNLSSKLKSEASGILNWLLEGCYEWQKSSLNEPKAIKEAITNYRCSIDSANQFFKEVCKIGDEYVTTFADIYDGYRSWCSDNSYDPIKPMDFVHSLQDNGFQTYRGFPRGARGYKGVMFDDEKYFE
jgi:putative DNA primase/helicase